MAKIADFFKKAENLLLCWVTLGAIAIGAGAWLIIAPYGSTLYELSVPIFFTGMMMWVTTAIFPFLWFGEDSLWDVRLWKMFPLNLALILLVLGIDAMFLEALLPERFFQSGILGFDIYMWTIARVLIWGIGIIIGVYALLLLWEIVHACYRFYRRVRWAVLEHRAYNYPFWKNIF